MSTKQLQEFRSRLNDLDEQLIRLLGARYEVCRSVAIHKSQHGIPMMQAERVEEVKDRCASLGAALSIPPEFMRELYSLIIRESCRLEDEIIAAEESRKDGPERN